MKVNNLLRYLLVCAMSKVKYGKRVSVGKTLSVVAIPRISTSGQGKVEIAAHCRIDNCEIVSVDGNVKIGQYTCLGLNDSIISRGSISIGRNCYIAPNVTIYDHNHNFGPNGIEAGYSIKDVKVGDHVWLGVGVIILAGTEIGNDCVIGAGTVVHGKIPEKSLVTGNRELLIRKLEDTHGKSCNYHPGV